MERNGTIKNVSHELLMRLTKKKLQFQIFSKDKMAVVVYLIHVIPNMVNLFYRKKMKRLVIAKMNVKMRPNVKVLRGIKM